MINVSSLKGAATCGPSLSAHATVGGSTVGKTVLSPRFELKRPVMIAGRALHGPVPIWMLPLVWHQRAQARQELSVLDSRQLTDVGLDAVSVASESRKPFWKP